MCTLICLEISIDVVENSKPPRLQVVELITCLYMYVLSYLLHKIKVNFENYSNHILEC